MSDKSFSTEQVSFLRSIGLDFDFSNLSDNEWIAIEEKVGDYITLKEDDASVSDKAKLGYSILDMIP